MNFNRLRNLGACCASFLVIAIASSAMATPVSLPLTTGGSNPLDEGSFSGGTQLQLSFTGSGDLVDSRYQVNPDGTLAAPGTGAFDFVNQGATDYPIINGGDGVNHLVGGGASYDATGSGYPFAGPMTTDTTDPTIIRFGTVVGTFSATPARADWFLIGDGATIMVPAGGAHLFLAVNDTVSSDNHGTYSGTLNIVPEPAALTFAAIAALLPLRRRPA